MVAKTELTLAIQYVVDKSGLPDKQMFTKWAQATLRKPAEVTIRLVDQQEGESLNRQFRGKHTATNILTFVYVNDIFIHGDIALCVPVIHAESIQQQKSLESHYAHLTVHGLLHLQGFDHLDDVEAATMEALEIDILSKLGFSNPYDIV
ncbi:MAG: rRNA maturation RNase YbeY [Nitrosomonas sp.]|nr:rRNA maturation RNase YbeY [Nitrosomonas sp.]MCC7136165.1 rRNA maturation RNase YbeY [Nitrosomonas sp.]